MRIRIKSTYESLIRGDRKVLLCILIFFFIIRLGVVIWGGQKDFEGADSKSYNNFALAITKNFDWLKNPHFAGSYRAPFYPFLIAAVYLIFGIQNSLAVYVVQALLSTLTCLFVYRLARRTLGEKVAVFSLIWAGFYIFYIHYSRMLLRETLIFFLVIVLFDTLYVYFTQKEKRKCRFWIACLIYTALYLTDPRYLFFLPFFGFLFLFYFPFRRGVVRYAGFILVSLALLVPWQVRNFITYDGFVLINTRTLDLSPKKGTLKAEGWIARKILFLGPITECGPDRENRPENRRYPSEEERVLIKAGFNPKNRLEAEVKAIRKNVYPATTFLGRKWYNFKEFWRPLRFKGDYRPCPDCRFVAWNFWHNLIFIVWYGILLPFMIVAVVKLIRVKNRNVWFLLFPLIVQNLLHVLQWAWTRYRNPVDCFIIILAGFGVVYTVEKTAGWMKAKKSGSTFS
ncbi:MAG: glycosyltransferase family 39 protein [Candidatus Aminicenantes bacterium]|nr:glycosyltransferase family 39 protein [Candidatus Aminicenantes bacterium]